MRRKGRYKKKRHSQSRMPFLLPPENRAAYQPPFRNNTTGTVFSIVRKSSMAD